MGDKFTYSMAAEIESLREQVEKLTEESVVLRASSRSKLETISSLELQVEKLTEERDDLLIACDLHNKNGDMAEQQLAAKDADNKWLRSAVTLQAEQLAALAEQNEKQRAFLEFAWKDIPMNEYAFKILEYVMNLPNLAAAALNRIKAETYREAAEIAGPEDSYQDQWFKAKSDSCAKLRAKADELEQSK